MIQCRNRLLFFTLWWLVTVQIDLSITTPASASLDEQLNLRKVAGKTDGLTGGNQLKKALSSYPLVFMLQFAVFLVKLVWLFELRSQFYMNPGQN